MRKEDWMENFAQHVLVAWLVVGTAFSAEAPSKKLPVNRYGDELLRLLYTP